MKKMFYVLFAFLLAFGLAAGAVSQVSAATGNPCVFKRTLIPMFVLPLLVPRLRQPPRVIRSL